MEFVNVIDFPKNQLLFIEFLFFLYRCCYSFCFIDFSSEFDDFLLSTPFEYGLFLFLRVFRCAIKVPKKRSPQCFWYQALNLLLRKTFIVAHKLGCVGFLFSFNSKKFLISLLIYDIIHFSFIIKLFSLHESVSFLLFLLLMCSCSPWWSGYFNFLYLLRLAVCPSMCSILEKVPWGAMKMVCSFVWVECSVNICEVPFVYVAS